MTDLGHLNALEDGLFRQRQYLATEKTEQGRQLRAVWIAQTEKEIAAERKFLGLPTLEEILLSDDELLAELVS